MNRYYRLSLTTLDKEGHDRTCNYWYLIQEYNGPYTAFTKREHLIQWLEDMGLALTQELPEHATHSYQKIEGEHRFEYHNSYDEFFALPAIIERRTCSNGQYTLGRITRDDKTGIRTLHVLNPNCEHRPAYDYHASRELVG